MDVKICYESYISEFIKKYNAINLTFLNNTDSFVFDNNTWNYKGSDLSCLQVMFIGKTGYGKSTTLNKIIGENIFKCDDVESCTKKLYSAEYFVDNTKQYSFSLCDLPGIGESQKADGIYIDWYKSMLRKSQCIVYILRADQRDFSVDYKIFDELFRDETIKQKVIIALNYADKIEPVSRRLPFELSEKQRSNLDIKKEEISKNFNLDINHIIYYSALENYNVDGLVSSFANIIKQQITAKRIYEAISKVGSVISDILSGYTNSHK